MDFSELELIQCGKKLASHLGLPKPSDKELSDKICEILIERENYSYAKEGLLTQEETASLLLQHFQTLICRVAGISEAELTIDWSGLVPEVKNALFKH